MTSQPQHTRCSLALHKKVLQLSVYSARSFASPPLFDLRHHTMVMEIHSSTYLITLQQQKSMESVYMNVLSECIQKEVSSGMMFIQYEISGL